MTRDLGLIRRGERGNLWCRYACHTGRRNPTANGELLMDVGPLELLIVLAIALLMFGSSKLPKLARSIGQAHKEFKQGIAEAANDEEPAASD